MAMCVGDIGTVISVDSGIALAGAAVKILAKAPGQDAVIWDAEVNGNSAEYTTEAGDLSHAGRWYFQIYADFGSGEWKGCGKPTSETIFPRLAEVV